MIDDVFGQANLEGDKFLVCFRAIRGNSSASDSHADEIDPRSTGRRHIADLFLDRYNGRRLSAI